MIILENNHLRAAIAAKGAELQGLINKQTGLEYMWNGDATYWGKHSPVLFPIVGGLKNNIYFYKGNSYHLSRHGFARDMEFSAQQLSATEALFTLTDNEASQEIYPFAFILQLRYRLAENILSCSYEVQNPGDKDLFFSVGAHPAFAVPLVKDSLYEDYWLQFNVQENLQRWKLENGLVASHAEPLPLQNNRLRLHADLFYEDAIVIKHMQSNQVTLGCDQHPHGIHFRFNDFPFFGIWAAKDAPFVCLEPWCGIADSVEHDQELKHKEGINTLSTEDNWERSWTVECF